MSAPEPVEGSRRRAALCFEILTGVLGFLFEDDRFRAEND